MSSTAQPEEITESLQATGTDGRANLRDTVAERLAAHRHRRAEQHAQLRERETELEAAARRRREIARNEQRRGLSAVREAVLARYEGSTSYREFLAAEAERALAQAEAEAEMAARKVRAVADAQLQLLEEMEQWKVSEPGPLEQAHSAQHAEARGNLAHALADIALGARELMAEPAFLPVQEVSIEPDAFTRAGRPKAGAPAVTEVSAGGLTVRLYEDLGQSRAANRSAQQRSGLEPSSHASHSSHSSDRRSLAAGTFEPGEELQVLESEIEFRRSPEFQDHVVETTPIPGNLIEFPRELIAARKARPRLAEGPLREEEEAAEPQLRIFEVEPEQDVHHFTPAAESTQAPDWQSLQLEASREPLPATPNTAQTQFATEPEAAPLELRVMAATVDGCLVGAASLCFFSLAAWVAGFGMRDLPLPLLAAAAVITFAVLGFVYQMLFFTLADWTPGMLYARIGLCTFGDRNPSRKAMRRRVLATLLAACPLGLGLLWMWMDDDRLGWHDRMSRMYQRAY